jgi:hypothetical protein
MRGNTPRYCALRPELTPDKFDNCFPAFDGTDYFRQGAQDTRNQDSIVRVANSNPEDRGTIVARRPQKRKIPILCNRDRRARNSFIPNLPVDRCQHAKVGNVNRLAAGVAQSLCQGRRKLRVNQK